MTPVVPRDAIARETAGEPGCIYQSACGRFLVAPREIVWGLSLRLEEDPCTSLTESMDLDEITAEARRRARAAA